MNEPTLPTTESKRKENIQISTLNVNYFSNNKKRNSSLFNNIKTSLLDDSISNLNYDLKRKSEDIDKFFIISYFIITLFLLSYFAVFINKFEFHDVLGLYVFGSTFSIPLNLIVSLILTCLFIFVKFIITQLKNFIKKDEKPSAHNSSKKNENCTENEVKNDDKDKNNSNKKSIEINKNRSSKRFNRNNSNINSNLSIDNNNNVNCIDDEIRRNNSNISKFSSTSSSNLNSNSTDFSINFTKNDYPSSFKKYYRTIFLSLFILMYLIQFTYGVYLIFKYISLNFSLISNNKGKALNHTEKIDQILIKYNTIKFSFYILFQTFLSGICLIFVVKKVNFQKKSMKIIIDEDFIKQAEREIKESQLISGHIQPSQKLIKMNNLFNRQQQNRISNEDDEVYKKSELYKQTNASNFSNRIITSTVKKEGIDILVKDYERSKTTIQKDFIRNFNENNNNNDGNSEIKVYNNYENDISADKIMDFRNSSSNYIESIKKKLGIKTVKSDNLENMKSSMTDSDRENVFKENEENVNNNSNNIKSNFIHESIKNTNLSNNILNGNLDHIHELHDESLNSELA